MTAPYQQRQEAKIYHRIDTLESLQRHLQWAVSLELSTIPPYLCALYSIQDLSSTAYSTIKSVAIEEMLHMMLACNLINSVGRSPDLSAENVASYPGFIPHHAAGGPYIQLQPFSRALMTTTFMPIEQPEPSPFAPPEGNHFQTIGQFYAAIRDGFENLVAQYGEEWLFGHDTGFQRGDTYFGSGGGHLFVIHNLEAAKKAITEITQQGEGATFPQPPVPGEEPFGGYEHYGPRLDGTYGPILGTPWEMSHFNKFKQMSDGTISVGAVYPMQANPSPDDLRGEYRDLAVLFNTSYTLVLRALELAFSSNREQLDFFGVAFPVMHFVLPSLATLLMQTPLNRQADPSLGPTAGPSFSYMPSTISDIVNMAKTLAAFTPERGVGLSERQQYQQLWSGEMSGVLGVLEGIQQEVGRAREQRL